MATYTRHFSSVLSVFYPWWFRNCFSVFLRVSQKYRFQNYLFFLWIFWNSDLELESISFPLQLEEGRLVDRERDGVGRIKVPGPSHHITTLHYGRVMTNTTLYSVCHIYKQQAILMPINNINCNEIFSRQIKLK